MMQTSFSLCLLAAVIDLGLSLMCEICGDSGNTCKGSIELCPVGEDKCGIILMAGTGVLEVRAIVKTCIDSVSCEEPFTSVNLGKAGGARTHVTCCVGNDCQRIIPNLQPLNTTRNGKRCPACYAVNSHECEEETVECTGDEFYCLEKSQSLDAAQGQKVTAIIKGCSNQGYCNRMLEKDFFLTPHSVATGNCTLASAAASVAPQLLGLFLPVVAGLLLLKAQD